MSDKLDELDALKLSHVLTKTALLEARIGHAQRDIREMVAERNQLSAQTDEMRAAMVTKYELNFEAGDTIDLDAQEIRRGQPKE